MTEVTSQQDAVAETEEKDPETPVTQPPGESPESPLPSEPAAPGKPAEPPPEPEPEKAKVKLPDTATKAGRKRQQKKAEPKKAKATDKEKEDRKKLEVKWAEFQKRFKERGTTTAMSRQVRELAETLGKNAPKWAQASAGKPAATPRADDPDLQLAHKATAFAMQGEVENGKVVRTKIKFGAPCSARQVGLMREQLKGKDILKSLHVSERKLAEYASGKVKATDLPEEARAAIKELNAKFDPKLKMWARKCAAIALMIHRERKSKARKPKAEQKEAVAA